MTVGVAMAGQVTADDFGRMVAELVPEVERASGRSFSETPALEITDFVTLWNDSVPLHVKRMEEAGFTESDIQAEMTRRDAESKHSLALEHDGRIYVLADRIEAAHRRATVPPSAIECQLAHELTHVLQHQNPPPPATSMEQWLDRRVLIEGHAEHISEVVCRARGNLDGVGLRRGWKGIEAVGSLVEPPDMSVVRHGFGREWSALVAEELGAEAIWDAYAEPPSRRDVIDTVQERAPGHAVELSEICASLQPDATVQDTDVSLLAEWRLVDRWALEALASVESVQAVALDVAPANGVMYRVDFEGSGSAARVLAARRELGREERAFRNRAYVDGPGVRVDLAVRKVFLGPFRQIDKLARSDDALRISYIDTIGEFPPWHQYWVARGKTLLVFRSEGEIRVFPRAKVAKAMVDALGESAR